MNLRNKKLITNLISLPNWGGKWWGLIALLLFLPNWGGHGVAFAQKDDVGLWLGADATKKFGKKWSVGANVEYRMKDNVSATDRFSAGVSLGYKPKKWLKAEAGYEFLDNREAGGYTSSGNYYKSTYWYPRHRFYAGATGTLKLSKRFRLSLRERWVYTYKPSYDLDRMNVNTASLNYGEITQKEVSGKAKNVLRSKLMVEYSIRKSAFTPFASAEMYNAWNVQKMRYSIGTSYDINKHHSIKAYYLFQDFKNDDEYDDITDQHVFGIDYNFTF